MSISGNVGSVGNTSRLIFSFLFFSFLFFSFLFFSFLFFSFLFFSFLFFSFLFFSFLFFSLTNNNWVGYDFRVCNISNLILFFDGYILFIIKLIELTSNGAVVIPISDYKIVNASKLSSS